MAVDATSVMDDLEGKYSSNQLCVLFLYVTLHVTLSLSLSLSLSLCRLLLAFDVLAYHVPCPLACEQGVIDKVFLRDRHCFLLFVCLLLYVVLYVLLLFCSSLEIYSVDTIYYSC